jgi:hypothetical protein
MVQPGESLQAEGQHKAVEHASGFHATRQLCVPRSPPVSASRVLSSASLVGLGGCPGGADALGQSRGAGLGGMLQGRRGGAQGRSVQQRSAGVLQQGGQCAGCGQGGLEEGRLQAADGVRVL